MKINSLLAILGLILPSIVIAGPLSQNWGLEAINAPQAWKLVSGGQVVKVCVIDTGIDVSHPELNNRLCDRDRDEFGWDFINNVANPRDKEGHGTHVAGIIRAVSPSACIIPVKWYSEQASYDAKIKATVASIKYCKERGAKIINFSGGGSKPSVVEKQAIREADQDGIIFVTAAGNNGDNIDFEDEYYPASYAIPNEISVASVNSRGSLDSSSNWGFKKVHVAAPGKLIFSTLPNNQYGYMTGTSMATPFVTGVIAMILSKYDNLTPEELKFIIIKSSKRTLTLKGRVRSSGIVDAFEAMKLAKKMSILKTKLGL